LGSRRHVILAYITSRLPTNLLETDIVLEASHPDFAASGRRVPYTIRLHQLVTVSTLVVQRELGELSLDTQAQIAEKLCNLLSSAIADR
jgi:mRNA interferase MazF